VELLLLRLLLLRVALVPLLVHEGFDFVVGHLQDALDDVGRGRDDVFDVVFADLVVEFLQDFF
jgi:hypothetical protein